MAKSRREFLKGGAALAAGAVTMRRARGLVGAGAAAPRPAAAAPEFTQFEYADVQLLDGPMLDQFRQNHSLFLGLNEDSLLKPFRQLAGMPAPGEDMGGWYSPSSQFDPPKNMTGYIPGHTFGQYMSGLARAYAVTGDKPTQQKVQRLVSGFAATVTPKFYDGYCLPAYTFDKTNCGLIDAHQFAKDPKALAVLNKATDAVLPWLPEKALDRKEMAARPHPNMAYTWDESYTLPENFYLAYQRGAGPRYRQLAQRFLQDDTYFNALAENQNVLPGQHAYSHVNALCSAMQCYLVDGSEKHLRAARNGFEFVREQSFATGGWGPDESFRHPGTDEIANALAKSHNSFETPCGAYGHFKIARYLMRVTGESTYGDGMEAILYNTILGARPIRPDGVSFYYADYNRDAKKVDYEQKWPCCSGTFPQLTADYGISSYLRSPKGIAVNLYVPSKVTWRQGGARVSMTQETRYPDVGETSLLLKMDRSEHFLLSLRVPEWSGPDSSVMVNGKKADVKIEPGAWAEIDRTWKDGDRVELSLDMPLRLVPLDGVHPNLIALVRGPVALFAIEPGERKMTRENMLAAERVGTSADWQVKTDQGMVTMKSYPAITTETYRLYQEV
ncbi:glycoside hydrolase family 127 protein [soil metagenome]